jgi:uncharacterized protein YjbI with pentapeptide repeats
MEGAEEVTLSDDELDEILSEHEIWVDTDKRRGTQADLTGVYLRGQDLRGRNLQQAIFKSADLEGATLRGSDLSGTDFRSATLIGVDLVDATAKESEVGKGVLQSVEKARFQSADLDRANLSGGVFSEALFQQASLDETVFQGADLSDANLSNAEGSEVDFRRANLENATLESARLPGSSFNVAGLQQTDLSKAIISKATFLDADFEKTKFRDADFGYKADLNNADLEKCDFVGAALPDADLSNSDLSEADFRHANLKGADLSDSGFWYADFTDAELEQANLKRVEFRGTDLTGTALHETNLRGANLRGSRGLQVSQLGCSTVSNARLPQEIARFTGLETVSRASQSARKVLVATLVLCAYVTLTSLTIQPGNEAPELPFVGIKLPAEIFYIVLPLALVSMQSYFLLSLQRIWDEMIELPAIFPNGKTVDRKIHPWLVTGLSRFHIFRMGPSPAPAFFNKKVPSFYGAQWFFAILVGWMPVPTTLLIMLTTLSPNTTFFGMSVDPILSILTFFATVTAVVSSWTTGRTLEGRLRKTQWTKSFSECPAISSREWSVLLIMILYMSLAVALPFLN